MTFRSLSSRRQLGLAAFALAADALLPVTASAQQFPNKPIRIVVPFTPGGGNDVFARQMAKSLGELRNQGVVVENKPGAGGNLGTEYVVRSAPDGTTLLLGHSGTVSINPALYSQLKYDTQKDLVPVAMFASSALLLVVPSGSPVKTVADLVAAAKAGPGKINYASSGSGTGGHLTGEMFGQKSGAKISHIPYKGTAPALTDLVGGQVQLMFDSLPSSMPFIKSGAIRPLAVTTARRSSALPDVPTVAASGYPDFDISTWYGVWAPAATPAPVVQKLSRAIAAIVRMPAVREQFAALGAEPVGNTPDEFAAFAKKELTKWARIVKQSGAKVD